MLPTPDRVRPLCLGEVQRLFSFLATKLFLLVTKLSLLATKLFFLAIKLFLLPTKLFLLVTKLSLLGTKLQFCLLVAAIFPATFGRPIFFLAQNAYLDWQHRQSLVR